MKGDNPNMSVDRRLDIVGNIDRSMEALWASGVLLRVALDAPLFVAALGRAGVDCRARGPHLVQAEQPFSAEARELVEGFNRICRMLLYSEIHQVMARWRPGCRVEVRLDPMAGEGQVWIDGEAFLTMQAR